MGKNNFNTDVALLSVTTTEFKAVTHFHEWKAKTFTGDDQIYDVATFERDGKQCSIVHAKISEMGMTAAAAALLTFIWSFWYVKTYPGTLLFINQLFSTFKRKGGVR